MNKAIADIPSIRPFMTKTYLRHEATTKRIVIHRGGTRSSKTYSILFNAVQWLLTGVLRAGEEIPSGKMAIVRKASTTISRTIQEDFDKILLFCCQVLSLGFESNKTEKTYKFKNRTIEFIGADDQQKLRGYKCNILYANEANELNYKKEFFQLMIRCTGPVFLDFNPSDPYVWIKTELEDKRRIAKGDVEVVVSTYKDNVNSFGESYLTKQQVDEIENLQYTDPAQWLVYGKGEYGSTEGLVVSSVTIIEEWPDWIESETGGLDFGFTNDPTSLYRYALRTVREEIQTDEGLKQVTVKELYCDQLIYESGLNEGDLKRRFSDLGIDKDFRIIADSSAPSTINALRRAGYNVRPVKKLKGSVVSGVGQLRGMRIFVTKRSHGAIMEQQRYKFKQHVNGNYLNEPIDSDNHFFDGTRYAVTVLDKKTTMKAL